MADSDYDVTIIDQLTQPLSALVDSDDKRLRKAVAGLLVKTALPFTEDADRKRLSKIAPKRSESFECSHLGEYSRIIDSISSSLEPCLKIDDIEAKKRIARRLLEAGIAILPEQDGSLCNRIASIALTYPSCARKRRAPAQKTSPARIEQKPAAPALAQAPAPVVPVPGILPPKPDIPCPAVPEAPEAQGGKTLLLYGIVQKIIVKETGVFGEKLRNRARYLTNIIAKNPEALKYIQVVRSGRRVMRYVADAEGLEKCLQEFVTKKLNPPTTLWQIIGNVLTKAGVSAEKLHNKTSYLIGLLKDNPAVMKHVLVERSGRVASYAAQNPAELEACIAGILQEKQKQKQAPRILQVIAQAIAEKTGAAGQELCERAHKFWAAKKSNPELMQHVTKASIGQRFAYVVSDVEAAKKAVLSLLERPARQGKIGYMPVLTRAFVEVFVGKYSVPESDAVKEANTLARKYFKDADLRACFSPVTQRFHTMQVVKKEELEARICGLIDEYVRKMGPLNEVQLQAALNYINGDIEEGQHSKKLATFYEFVLNAFSEYCRQGASVAADAYHYTKEWIHRDDVRACLAGEAVTKPKELKSLLVPLVIEVQSKNLAGRLKKSDFEGRIFTIEEIRQLLGTNNLDQYRKHFGLLGEPRCPSPGAGVSAGYGGENVYNFLVTVGAGMWKSPQSAAD